MKVCWTVYGYAVVCLIQKIRRPYPRRPNLPTLTFTLPFPFSHGHGTDILSLYLNHTSNSSHDCFSTPPPVTDELHFPHNCPHHRFPLQHLLPPVLYTTHLHGATPSSPVPLSRISSSEFPLPSSSGPSSISSWGF